MSTQLAFIYHEVFDGRGFSRLSDSWRRYRLGRTMLREVGLLGPPGVEDLPLVEHEPVEATDADILTVHTLDHLRAVREADASGVGLLDYGDTPAWPGVFRRAQLAIGGTLLASRLVAQGSFQRAFNPAGGLHHAQRDRAGGFCPFNDVVVAVRALQRDYGYRRIAIVDLDGHHGDGTEALLYAEPILKISLHRYDGRFYPRTGAPSEVGRGEGFGYNVNVPLERGADEATYLDAFDRWAVPAIRRYCPRIIFVVVGADSHWADPLVRLGVTLNGARALAGRLRDLSDEFCKGRLVAVAGGGYAPEHVARWWTVFLATLTDAWQDGDPLLSELLAADQAALAKKWQPQPS